MFQPDTKFYVSPLSKYSRSAPDFIPNALSWIADFSHLYEQYVQKQLSQYIHLTHSVAVLKILKHQLFLFSTIQLFK